jgi:hypothetical protein
MRTLKLKSRVELLDNNAMLAHRNHEIKNKRDAPIPLYIAVQSIARKLKSAPYP